MNFEFIQSFFIFKQQLIVSVTPLCLSGVIFLIYFTGYQLVK